MSIFDATENALMLLIFNATAWSNYADNAASTPQTNVHCSLHTADPADAGTLATSEASYTSYARVNVARTSGGWTVTSNSVSPVAIIAFPAATGGTNTITNFSTGKTGGGSAAGLFTGTVTPNISVTSGVTPQLSTSSTITID